MSLLSLAWWLDAALAVCLWGKPAPVEREWTIRFGPRSAVDRPVGEVMLLDVHADGRRLRAEEIRIDGPLRRNDVWSSLSHGDGAEPASAKFRARRAVAQLAVFSGAGSVEVVGDDEVVVVDCDQNGGSIFVDLPGLQRPAGAGWWLAAAALLGWSLCAPWRSRRTTAGLLLTVLVVVHAAAAATLVVSTTSDSVGYLPSLDSVLMQARPSYFPPGYGLLLELADAIPFVPLGTALVWIQHALMVAAIVVTWRFVERVADWRAGCVFLALATWSAAPLVTPQMAMSETMALAGMAFAVAFVDRAVRAGGGTGSLVAAAVCLALVTLARVVPLAAAGPAMAVLLLALPTWRAVARAAALTFGVAALLVALPMAWCAVHGNGFSLSAGIGAHLYNRVVYAQKQLAPSAPITAAVQQLLPGTDLTSLRHWELGDRLASTPASPHSSWLIDAVAIEALRSAPWDWFWFTFPHAWRNFVAAPGAMLVTSNGTAKAEPRFESEPCLGLAGDGMDATRRLLAIHDAAWPWICWLATLSLLVAPWCRSPRRAFAIAWLPAGYLLATSFVEFHLPRYNIAVAPFVLAIATLPLGLRRRDPVASAASGFPPGAPAPNLAARP